MRLSNVVLSSLKNRDGLHVPPYDRSHLSPSIAHIGMGHFHRSHFLVYLDELMSRGLYEGGVFEIDIIPSNKDFVRDFKAQDCLYSVLSLSADGKKELRINGPVAGYANYCEEPALVEEILSSSRIGLITLTITEKGYCYKDDMHCLDFDNLDIRHDLESDERPRTAIGCLSRALNIRYKISKAPVTILSCDNIPENGRVLRECILQYCEIKYPHVAKWIEKEIAFPNSMVDRITPATTASDIRSLEADFGIEDRCPVHCEDFMQWVIEDRFCTPIPDFSKVGALIVSDVKPYELMKIRLLNGSHSALSYPAYMMGITMVHEAMQNRLVGKFIRDCYMQEITSTLAPVAGVDLDEYKDRLVSRFSNPYIADTVLRLASDGSKKISNAIMKPLEECVAKGLRCDAIIFALALWQFYFSCRDSDGNPMPIDDPKAKELMAVADRPQDFLCIAGLDEKIAKEEAIIKKMQDYLSKIKRIGVENALSEFVHNYA